MLKRTVQASVLLLCSACGGNTASEPVLTSFDDACDSLEGCREPRVTPSGQTEDIWRVLIQRDSTGAVSVERLEQTEVEMGVGVPLGRRSGTHLVTIRDTGDQVLDAQLIAFPSSLEFEARGESFGAATVDLSAETVSSVLFLRAPESGIEIVIETPSGEVVHRRMIDEVLIKSDSATEVGKREESLTSAGPSCPHVALLEGEADLEWVPSVQRNGVAFVEPGPVQRATVRAALGLMPRLLCHGFARIAFGEVPALPNLGGVVVIRAADFVLINALPFSEQAVASDELTRLRLLQTILHEATHATEAMLNDEGMKGAQFAGGWSADGRSIATDTIDHVRLEKSMREEWIRMQDSFVSLGWAHKYPSDIFQFQSQEAATAEIRAWSPTQTTEGGAMSRYGATYYADDIAEMVAWAIAGPVIRAAGIPESNNNLEDSACQIARQYSDGGVPSRFAAVFSKLHFVRDLGMILPEDLDTCLGDGLFLRAETPGMHFYEEDEYQRSFGQGVRAQIGTVNGRSVFEMVAEGEADFGDDTFPATGRLVIDLASADTATELISWPRGVYTLAPQQPHAFELRLEGAAAGNFNVIDGFVLVAESSNDVIAGSVFIRIGFRINAPIPVPQTFDPPLTVQFRIEN